jgi:hypothetical protein
LLHLSGLIGFGLLLFSFQCSVIALPLGFRVALSRAARIIITSLVLIVNTFFEKFFNFFQKLGRQCKYPQVLRSESSV